MTDLTTGARLDGLDDDAVRAIAGDEPSWLVDRRLAATKRYTDQAWPDSRADEFWRSTPFAKRIPVDLPVARGSDATTGGSLVSSLDTETVEATIVDGALTDVVVPAALADQGVVVLDLAEAASSHERLVREHLGSLTTSVEGGTGSDEDRTITASDAAWTGGVFVHVPDEVEVAAPIGIHVHVTEAGAHLPRVLVVLGHHARATLYLEHTSTEQVEALVDEVAEFVVGDAARLDVVSLQEWGDGDPSPRSAEGGRAPRRHRAAPVGDRRRPHGAPASRGRPRRPRFLDAPARPVLRRRGAVVRPAALRAPPRAPRVLGRAVQGRAAGRSRTIFRGNIFVHKDAVGTATDETNRSLILSPGARADSTPFLEIECADITAGHGSATGQIDARHLFYLESRGIPRAQALRLIVQGFFREILTEVELPGVEDRAMEHIEAEIDSVDVESIAVSDAALRDGWAEHGDPCGLPRGPARRDPGAGRRRRRPGLPRAAR
jgi:Fe-S cluster assembly protein SufD